MLEITRKLGGYQKVYDILKNSGWTGKYNTLMMQYYRRKASRDVSLLLWDYCQKNNIPVSIEDFREKAE